MYKLLIILLTTFFALQLNAQLRHGSCSSKSQSKFYITPYIGIGGGSYSYDLNNTVIGPGPDSTVYNTSKGGVTTPVVGFNLMYSIGKANIGGGFEWQGVNGSTSTEINAVKHSAYLYKFYGRLEFALYSDPFNDVGVFFQGGLSFPKKFVGESNDLGMFVAGGIFYNYIINSTSSIFITVDYEYSAFTSNIAKAVSNHRLLPIKLTVGYRFWF